MNIQFEKYASKIGAAYYDVNDSEELVFNFYSSRLYCNK